MAQEKKDQRIPIMMSVSEVARIDEWRSKQPGLPARAEAVRRLVEQALDAPTDPEATTPVKISNF